MPRTRWLFRGRQALAATPAFFALRIRYPGVTGWVPFDPFTNSHLIVTHNVDRPGHIQRRTNQQGCADISARSPRHLARRRNCARQSRGTRVDGISEQAIPAVLARLAGAAARAGHLSPVVLNPAPVYRQLADALKQLDVTPENK